MHCQGVAAAVSFPIVEQLHFTLRVCFLSVSCSSLVGFVAAFALSA
jgi:hypothetical protein